MSNINEETNTVGNGTDGVQRRKSKRIAKNKSVQTEVKTPEVLAEESVKTEAGAGKAEVKPEKITENTEKTAAPTVEETVKEEAAPVKPKSIVALAAFSQSESIDLGGGVSAGRAAFVRTKNAPQGNNQRPQRDGNGYNRNNGDRRQQGNRDNNGNYRDNRNQNKPIPASNAGFFKDRNDRGDRKPGDFKNNGGQKPNNGGHSFGQKSSQSRPEPTETIAVETRRPRTQDKDTAKKEKRIEGTRRAGATAGGGQKDKYNSAQRFIGGKMGVNEVMSDEFSYSGDYDIDTGASKRSKNNKRKEKEAEAEARAAAQKLTNVKIPPVLTVREFAELIKKTATEVIKKLMLMGMMVTQNQEIDYDTAALIAMEFGIEAEPEIIVTDEEILLEDPEDLEPGEDAVERPPVVVVMGHVDHGKTSLLDAIRSTSVTTGEAGGITQHIGAYTVTLKDHKITFLDTPGHEAFTAMRARGAQVTDVAIIVVAADDGVMPQTIEAINHAKAANVSIVVAVNKIDKEGANIERVKNEMAEQGIVCEEWGGDVPFIPVSAKKGENIDLLLETVLLTTDILQLKASPTKQAKGTIIEAKLDKNKGPVATLLVQRGTLRSGDAILSETTFGHIRTMTDDKGRSIKEAGPSTPVEITGLPEVPEAGKVFYVVNKDEKLAKKVCEERKTALKREQTTNLSGKITLEELFSQIKEGEIKDLNIIIKADVKGSVEAIKSSLEKLSNDEVRVKVIHGGVGGINEGDVLLAEASNAIIIGFNVRPIGSVGEEAKAKGVDVKLYRVIYDAINDVKAAMIGMLAPEFKEVVTGHIEIRKTFKISGVGTIAGGYVLDGKVLRNSEVRIVRDGIVVYEGKLASLKRFKDDVKEVNTGYECGLSFERYDDIKEGDVCESYIMEQIQRTL